MKIFTFGIDTHYPGSKHGDVPDTWVTQTQATALVDAAMKEKFLGMQKYATRDDAEKAVIQNLYMKKTGVEVSGDTCLPLHRAPTFAAFFGCMVATIGVGLGVTRMRKGL